MRFSGTVLFLGGAWNGLVRKFDSIPYRIEMLVLKKLSCVDQEKERISDPCFKKQTYRNRQLMINDKKYELFVFEEELDDEKLVEIGKCWLRSMNNERFTDQLGRYIPPRFITDFDNIMRDPAAARKELR